MASAEEHSLRSEVQRREVRVLRLMSDVRLARRASSPNPTGFIEDDFPVHGATTSGHTLSPHAGAAEIVCR
jgi:hypothetical protein